MPTTFDLTTYPLEQASRVEDDSPDKLDILDDGRFRYRVLGTTFPYRWRLVFTPMSDTEKRAFELYLRTNRGIEFDVTPQDSSPTVTYRGYVAPKSLRGVKRDGLWTMSLDFRGSIV